MKTRFNPFSAAPDAYKAVIASGVVPSAVEWLDRAGIASIDDLVGQPWSVVLPAFDRTPGRGDGRRPSPHHQSAQQQQRQKHQHQQGNGGAPNARSDHS